MTSFKQMIQSGDIKRADAMKARLDDIHEEDGFNLREQDADFVEGISELTAYIVGGGVIPPLEVRPREEGGVWVVDGHRRRRALLAARKAGCPIEWVEIRAFTGNDADRVARIITSQEGRKLKPLEIARGYKRLKNMGLDVKDIAVMVNKTRQHIEQSLKLAEANTDVQQMVATGKVAAAVAVKAVRKHGDKAGETLSKALKDSGKAKLSESKAMAWRDAPTGPGIWVDSVNHFVIDVADTIDFKPSGAKWFGPIPRFNQKEKS